MSSVLEPNTNAQTILFLSHRSHSALFACASEDVEDVQGNETAASDPSQEAEEVLTSIAVLRTQKILI